MDAIGATMHDSAFTMHGRGTVLHGNQPTMHGGVSGSQGPNVQVPDHTRMLLAGLGRRTEPENLHTAIRQLCTWKPHSVADLAKLLARSHTCTRTVVAEMVTAGEVEQTKEGQPRHPEQTYRPPSGNMKN